MNTEIPFSEELQELVNNRTFKRVLVLWNYYLKQRTKTAVSEETGIPTSTVGDIIEKWRQYGTVDDLPRSGKPKQISKEDEERILELQEEDRYRPATSIYKQAVSEARQISYKQTMSIIHENFNSVYAPYKISLTPDSKRDRAAWCQSRINWRSWKWDSVVWTDEKMFRVEPFGKKIQVKIHFDESADQFSVPLKREGGGGIMFWGAISSKGKLHFSRLKGKIDSTNYSRFLQESALPDIRRVHGQAFILQQDNAPPHKGHTIDTLRTEKVTTLDWPAHSPDLNPIEQVWLWMDTKLKSERTDSLEELEVRVVELWDEIPENVILNYVKKVKSKVEWVASNGGELCPDSI